MILLTVEEAKQLRELNPVKEPRGDLWMLPVTVLDDPAAARHREFLSRLPLERRINVGDEGKPS